MFSALPNQAKATRAAEYVALDRVWKASCRDPYVVVRDVLAGVEACRSFFFGICRTRVLA